MPRSIILVDPFGGLQATRNSAEPIITAVARGYELMEMRRVTEIHMESSSRLYMIEWQVRLALSGTEYVARKDVHSYEHHCRIFWACKPPQHVTIGAYATDNDLVFFFDTYEAAVEYEIECLNALRRIGVVFP